MTDLSRDIVGLVEVVARPLVEHAEDLEVTVAGERASEILIEIRTHEDDAGKIIGRQGRVIKAIRTLARAAASRDGVHVEVELID